MSLNLRDSAAVALIRAAASTQTLYCFFLNRHETLTNLNPVACRSESPCEYGSEKFCSGRAWNRFFPAFRVAVKKRDRSELRKLMSSEFFSSGGNDAGPEAAFQFWDDSNVRGWQAFTRVLARGTVPMAAWWDTGEKRKYLSRGAPPAANIRRNMKREAIDWYAVFEFRDGRWYCTIFNQCCD